MMRILLILLAGLSYTTAFSQTKAFREYMAPGIKSVKFIKKGVPVSYPVLELNEAIPLVLSFDDLNGSPGNYYYSITLCNSDWTESRLTPSEYSQGLFSYALSDYQSSANTLVRFIHYELELPNSDIQLVLPGNYILRVFENNDIDNPVLLKRFVVVDKKVEVTAQLKIPSLPEFRENSQQIDFSILHPDFPLRNPHQEITVVVTKNFDWNSALTNLKPLFIRSGNLNYNYTRENLFIGGNEFRSFNINSRKYPSQEVINIASDGKTYTATLATDKPRHTYFFREDINGLFLNENKDVRNADHALESDYFNVRFSLNANILPYDGEIYIYGALTGYLFNDESRMKYNAGSNLYENTLLLKQGYYDYQYVFIPKTTGTFDESEIEGSFTETGNNYFIFVYYRGFGDRYDRLIGYRRIAQR